MVNLLVYFFHISLGAQIKVVPPVTWHICMFNLPFPLHYLSFVFYSFAGTNLYASFLHVFFVGVCVRFFIRPTVSGP